MLKLRVLVDDRWLLGTRKHLQVKGPRNLYKYYYYVYAFGHSANVYLAYAMQNTHKTTLRLTEKYKYMCAWGFQ